jgi:RNA polymerase sigma factor (sigma-70 family)
MKDDAELLRSYAEASSEADFAEWVQRHLNLVYRAALRQLGGDAHRAEDVTQRVFTLAARRAGQLSRHPALTGWLYTTTHLTVREILRAERRRQRREQEAHTMHELFSDPGASTDWNQIRPMLDEAMQSLNQRDREILLLRFFEERPFAQIGAKLALSEDAARMRVERSLDKLRALLVGRGFASTSAALATMLTAEAGVAAPAGLSATVASAALAGSAVPLATGAAIGGVLQTLAFMSTAKTTAIVGVAALCAAGTGFYYSAAARETNRELTATHLREAEVEARIASLTRDLRTADQQVTSVDRDSATLFKAARGAVASAATAEAEAKIPITNDLVQVRYQQAKALQQSGQWEAALREFLWCYDVGMPQISSFSGVRHSGVLDAIKAIAAHDPEALTALRARRDRAGQEITAGTEVSNAISDFVSLNRVLGEEERTLQAFDQLPAGDPRRQTMAIYGHDPLIAARRYADVAEGTPYSLISSGFEASIGFAAPAQTGEAGAKYKENVVESTAQSIEVLAGIGDLAHARALIGRLLSYSNTDATMLAIKEHVERAGHPELASDLSKP